MITKRVGRRWLTALAIVLLLASPGLSLPQECRISVHSTSDQLYPDISGARIIWQDTANQDLVLFDLSDGSETRLASGGAQPTLPVIEGSLVAWLENPLSPYRVILLNLATGNTRVLSTNGYSPDISGDRIIWVDSNLGSRGIALYNVTDDRQGMVITDPYDQSQPAISGDRVVWVNGSSSDQIYVKSLSTGDEALVSQSACSNPPCTSDPAFSGDRVAWSDYRDDFDRDIYLSLLSTLSESIFADFPVDQITPSIDGDRIVWMNGSDIYLGDLSGANPPLQISTGTGNFRPRLSGDRVVWYKGTGNKEIYLYTIGSSEPCPSASFTADHPSGISPLAVQFMDTSSGSPGHWLWDFGDGGTSSDQNPVHTYPADGTYSVSLTVSNTVGRDYAARTGYIRVGPIPIVSFSSNQTYGIAPLPVRFADTSSGSPASWSWDFGDGGSSTGQTPVHTYGTPGTYSVSLAATNNYGTGTGNMPGLVQVLNGVNLLATTNLDGLSVQTVGSRQEITLDSTKMVSDTFNPGDPASFSFTPQPSSGWQKMTFSSSDGFGFARDGSGMIRGNLSSCTLESRELIPSTFTTDAGNNLPVSYQLQLSAYPALAQVNATIWEKVIPVDDTTFKQILATRSSQFTSVIDTAYTLSFVSTNLTGVQSASLNLSAGTPWVQKYGGGNNITVIRHGDDGIDEVLNPTATFTDTAKNLDFFTIPSPHGLSRFALVSATGSSNLIQMGTRLATQLIQSSGTGHSSNDYQGTWESSPRQANPPAERPAATYYGEGKIDTTVAGIARDPVIITTADHSASLAIDAGTEALDSIHEPLTLATARVVTAGSIPAMPDGTGIRFTGMAYDMGPDGATFSPPATISFTVPDNQWDPNARYSIRTYSPKAGSWDEIPTTADPGTRTVSGKVSHLCLFGLFTAPLAGPATPAPPVRASAGQPQAQPKPLPKTPMGTFTGMVGWIYETIAANPQVSFTFFLTGLAGLYTYTRRSWLSRNRTWITLYLVSLTGFLWALYLFTYGGSLWESLFLFTTITGLNLIVHILRFDLIDLTSRARYGSVSTARRW